MNCQDLPEFSPDAKLVLFRCLPKGEEGPSNLYWVHPDGTGLHALTHAPADKQYLRSSFSPSFSEREGWITVGRTPGYGKEGNADVFRILIEDGRVVRSVNLTKNTLWDSSPYWGTHLLARGQSVIALVEGRDPSVFGPPSCPYSPKCVE